MRKTLILISMLLIASLLLMACGAQETEEPILEEPILTEEPMATEAGIPATGDDEITPEQPFLLENQLDYDVWNGENDQIGEVEDMVIDLSNSRVDYVFIETGGFLDIGDTDSLVPWNALQLVIDADQDPLTADDNVFVLQFDQDLLEDSPDFDLATLPAFGDPADTWDDDLVDFWGNQGFAEPEPMEGAEANQLQGVMLATNLLDANVFFDPDLDITGIDFGEEMAIDNAIVDPATGQLQFLVINTFFGDETRLIPVPLTHFLWNVDTQSFIIGAEPVALETAPFFAEDFSNETFDDNWQTMYFDYWTAVPVMEDEEDVDADEALTPEQPFLLENQLDYDIWNGENDQIGEVENMVIDLSSSQVDYVFIETGGFLDIGDTDSLVPWNALQLVIDADPDVLSADDNVFVLQFDQNLLEDAPDFDPATLPAAGVADDTWDDDVVDFWGNQGFAEPEPMEGAEANQLQGVMLATNLLDANVFFDPGVDLTVTDFGEEMAVDNAIVDPANGRLEFLVINALFGDVTRLIPVPLNQFLWDLNTQSFVLNTDPGLLETAPFVEDDFSNETFEEGWENAYFDYWR